MVIDESVAAKFLGGAQPPYYDFWGVGSAPPPSILYAYDLWCHEWREYVCFTNIFSGIFFDFSHSDNYLDIWNDCIAQQTCLSHNRAFEVNVVELRLDVFHFVVKKQASQKRGSLFCLKFALHIFLLNQELLVLPQTWGRPTDTKKSV